LISELSRSNVFIFKKNTLITPHRNILKGITRKTVLEIAKNQFDIEERSIKLTELFEADEVFTTSSTKQILPISRLNNHVLGEGKIGKNTQALLTEFKDLVKKW
jgi:branched-subunit amino acid aminotransferase/4-amino-4-deoxychorismate lyase